jgi:hypothetical protein
MAAPLAVASESAITPTGGRFLLVHRKPSDWHLIRGRSLWSHSLDASNEGEPHRADVPLAETSTPVEHGVLILGPMRRSISVSVAIFTLIVSSASAARADNDVDYPSSSSRKATDRKYVTVTFNPLSMLLGHYGGNVEIVPFVHHGITITGFYVNTFESVYENGKPDTRRDQRVTSAGGELGYRFYSGERGANGFFIGPSLLISPIFYARDSADGRGETAHLHAIGGAVDLGGQLVTKFGLTFGGGVGVQYLPYKLPTNHQPEILGKFDINPQVLPRFLLTMGWSF